MIIIHNTQQLITKYEKNNVIIIAVFISHLTNYEFKLHQVFSHNITKYKMNHCGFTK